MALYLPDQNALFLHPPKTGGMFVATMLEQLGVNVETVGYQHSHKDLVGPIRWKRRPYTFTFVRHPVTWYGSYWEMKMRWPASENKHWYYFEPTTLWHPNWEIDPQYGSDDFARWIRRVTTRRDYLYDMFRAYTGLGTPDRVDFIGKQEHLLDDLFHVLDTLAIDYEPEQLARADRVNFASDDIHASWTPELRKLVVRAEHRTLIDYGYDERGPREGPRGRPAARTRPIVHPPRYSSRLAQRQPLPVRWPRTKQVAKRVLPVVAVDFLRARRAHQR